MCMVCMLVCTKCSRMVATGRYHQAGASLYMPSGRAEEWSGDGVLFVWCLYYYWWLVYIYGGGCLQM
jgi:hypothetical protein